MADIDQEETANDVIFSGTSADAQEWMQENYENKNLIFRLPDEHLRALEFRRDAEEHGFKVEVWQKR
jgi:hypothetical protein